jgi:hypothetical protein
MTQSLEFRRAIFAAAFIQRYSELNKDGSFAGQSLASFDAEGRDR